MPLLSTLVPASTVKHGGGAAKPLGRAQHGVVHSMPHWGWGGKGESALSLVGASWSLCVGAGGSEASPRRAGCPDARRRAAGSCLQRASAARHDGRGRDVVSAACHGPARGPSPLCLFMICF